eukprot:TRINITY_DN8362_c0_g1_i1.p1 TRINITY_DN8362_c0_g1~~TRINITY_DN8362_c0_g1_i1.p1  ORF type:complete len:584 (+),score=114.38 TRINITY_DN8362_c0_g1_i1:95-1846(+)
MQFDLPEEDEFFDGLLSVGGTLSSESCKSSDSEERVTEWSDDVAHLWSSHVIAHRSSVSTAVSETDGSPAKRVSHNFSERSESKPDDPDSCSKFNNSHACETVFEKVSSSSNDCSRETSGNSQRPRMCKSASNGFKTNSMRHMLSGSETSDPESVDPELIRGVALFDLLCWTAAHIRCLWTRGIDSLTTQQSQSLWALSRKVDRIDAFLSHTWSDSNLAKYTHLLLQSGWWLGLVGAVASLAALFFAPDPAVSVVEHGSVFPTCFLLIPLLAGFIFLSLSPLLFDLLGWGPVVFLDAVCINQSDEQQKLAGITGLQGVLSASQELHIILTPSYLSRLWCVFEVAAFLHLHPDADVVVRVPVFDLNQLLMAVLSWLSSLVYLLSFRLQLVTVCALVISGGVFLLICQNLQSMQAICSQLQGFSALRAQCVEDSDRLYIARRIRAWFGSIQNFDSHVQQKIAPQIEALVKKNNSLTYGQAWLCLSFFPLCLEVASLKHMGLLHSWSAELLCRSIEAAINTMVILPGSAYILLGLARSLASRPSLQVGSKGFSLITGSTFTLALALARWLIAKVCQSSLLWRGAYL